MRALTLVLTCFCALSATSVAVAQERLAANRVAGGTLWSSGDTPLQLSLGPTLLAWTKQPAEQREQAKPGTGHGWYGLQTLLADGLGLLFMASQSEPFVAVGAAAFLAGPPVVHFAHGNFGRGFGSLALRVFSALLIFAGVKNVIEGDGYAGSSDGTALAAGVIGAVGAVVLDAAVFAWCLPD